MYDKMKIGVNEAFAQIGPRKGMLKKKCPPMNTYGSAVWNAIQFYSNPYKVGFGHLFFMDAETRELYDYVKDLGKSIDLRNFDSDANALRSIGVF
jgi:hypothetical protein